MKGRTRRTHFVRTEFAHRWAQNFQIRSRRSALHQLCSQVEKRNGKIFCSERPRSLFVFSKSCGVIRCCSRKRAFCHASELHRFISHSTLAADRRECPPHRSTTRLIERSPWIVDLENFLTPSEIPHLIRLTDVETFDFIDQKKGFRSVHW